MTQRTILYFESQVDKEVDTQWLISTNPKCTLSGKGILTYNGFVKQGLPLCFGDSLCLDSVVELHF